MDAEPGAAAAAAAADPLPCPQGADSPPSSAPTTPYGKGLPPQQLRTAAQMQMQMSTAGSNPGTIRNLIFQMEEEMEHKHQQQIQDLHMQLLDKDQQLDG
eukprot:SAG22_NODE_3923_length_1466_cov_2.021214_2_plen_100_part_00